MAKPSPFIRFLMTTSRIVVLTAMFAALGMGVGIFVGIFGTVILAMIRHTHADMANSYRHFAIPLAILCGTVAFGYQVSREVSLALRSRT